jgi:hypothetical protein
MSRLPGYLIMCLGLAVMASCSVSAMEIRNPGVIEVPGDEGRSVIACARCHRETLKQLWHEEIEDQQEVPDEQHTEKVKAGILSIWQSLTVTSRGIDKTGFITHKLARGGAFDESEARRKLKECSQAFDRLLDGRVTTEEHVVAESARIDREVHRVLMAVEEKRREIEMRKLLGIIIVSMLVLGAAALKGLLSLQENECR